MELGSVIGFISGIVIIFFSILLSADFIIGDAGEFVNWPSVLIVFGGTIASAFIGFSIEKLMSGFKAFKVIFKPPMVNPSGAIDQIVSLANTARKEGVLALEESTQNMDDEFLVKGINLIVDGTDPDLVKGIMETELAYIEERHGQVAGFWDFIASVSPAYGMLGTLIGLILMLLKLDDPAALGPAMAIALVTTFYGSFIANFIGTPVANKLRSISNDEVLLKTVLIEGMLSIQAGENPRIIEEKLKSFLSPAVRQDVGAAVATGGRGGGEEE